MMRSKNSTLRKYRINLNQIKRMNEVNKMKEDHIPPGTGIQESHQYRRSQSETDGTKQHHQSFVSKDSKRGSSILHIETYEKSSAQLQDMGSVFDNLQRKRGSRKKWKQFLSSKLDSVPFIIASIVFTLLVSCISNVLELWRMALLRSILTKIQSVFFQDFILPYVQILYTDLIKTAAAPASLDDYFLAFTIAFIVLFSLEIFVSCLVRPGYFLKFYFWMDFIASFSLLCDIPGFVDLITFDGDDSNRHLTLDRMAQAAQAGARAARIMQVISVLQLLRLRAKRIRLGIVNRTFSDDLSRTGSETEADNKPSKFQMTSIKPQSRVGEKLTEKNDEKGDSWGATFTFSLAGFLMLGFSMKNLLFLKKGKYLDNNIYRVGGRDTGFVLNLQIHNETFFDSNKQLESFRASEKQSSVVKSDGCKAEQNQTVQAQPCLMSKAIVDVRWDVRFQAILDIGRVTILLIVLSVGAVLFIRDTDTLVLQPIERMIQKVKLMSQNPLSAQAMKVSKSKKSEKDLETRILENSIGKFCDLLSIGFGEAGSEIISNNIRSGGDLNPMLPGKKEDVMEFVNYIASIVHAEVSLHGGAANKNIGDAFLVVWKLPTSDKSSKSLSRSRGSIIEAKSAVAPDDPAQSTEQLSQHIADAALASMLIIHSSLKRSKILAKNSQRSDIQDRLPDFTVSMGFGLHVGWAIEGAIGSRYKIDPSYLSPHVNMAARLEAATKQYKVPILLSDSFVSLLSVPVRTKCRAIDTVCECSPSPAPRGPGLPAPPATAEAKRAQPLVPGTRVVSSSNPLFYLSTNGVTVMCPRAKMGATGTVNGVVYTKRSTRALYGLVSTSPSALRSTCTSSITDMSRLFSDAPAFNTPIGSWDTSRVTNMSNMFSDASAFNQDISKWDTGRVRNMRGMFDGAQTFNQDIGRWDTGQVTDMSFMFYFAPSFNQDISRWDTGRVRNMRFMFFGASAFNRPIGRWDTSRVISMSGMFTSAISTSPLAGGTLVGWDTGRVTSMSSMFDGAQTFNQDIGRWDTGQVTDMSRMFYFARAFNQDIGRWDTSRVKNMRVMFKSAIAFNKPIGRWDTGRVRNMRGLFADASAFNKPIGRWDTGRVRNMRGLFADASAFNKPIGRWNTGKVTDMSIMLSGASSFNQDIGKWDTGRVTDMRSMFFFASAFNQNISLWCVSLIPSKPSGFSQSSPLLPSFNPKWGTCPE
eukprot:jgi/Picsp_1/3106/NSC_05947-R1_membrane-associated lipoprotein precurser